jgi:hypothetical protein
LTFVSYKAMSIFMTLSVYSLRVSSDQAPQSKYLPMVTLYYMLGISYTFMAYIWFILANEFSTKEYLPKYLEIFAVKFIKRALFWLFNEKPLWKSNKIATKKIEEDKAKLNDNMAIVKLKAESNSSEIKNDPGSHKEIHLSSIPNLPSLVNLKCGNCDFCDKCKSVKDLEKSKKNKKALNDANVKAWNYFVAIILFIIMLSCNLMTWLLVSYPPPMF